MQSLLGLPNYGTNIGFMTFFEVQGGPTKFSKQGAKYIAAATTSTPKGCKVTIPTSVSKCVQNGQKLCFLLGKLGT